MATGTVKFFNTSKGYGFITKDDGGDIFFHINSCKTTNDPEENMKVQFTINPKGKKGPVAEDVTELGTS